MNGWAACRGVLLGALAIVVWGAPCSGRAQPTVAEADRAYQEGAYAEAGRGYEDALASGGLTRTEVARAHLRLATLAALGDERRGFESHAVIALALDPELPSPALEGVYAALFGELVETARRLRVEFERAEGGLSVRVHAPPGVVHTVILRGRNGWERTLAWQGETLWVVPPPDARPLAVQALDESGNLLARAGVQTPPDVAIPPPVTVIPAPVSEPEEPSLVESPWLWIGVGLLAVGIGVVVGLTAFGERYVLDAPVVR